jgi:hypothetical protein
LSQPRTRNLAGTKIALPLFDLGQLVAIPGALAALEKMGRALRGRSEENQLSLEKGFRLLSYKTNAGDRLWIITESDRAHTM